MSILCVGLVCVDLVHNLDGFPDQDSDQRVIAKWRTRGGTAPHVHRLKVIERSAS